MMMNYYIDERTILVEDSLSALQELAKFIEYLNLLLLRLLEVMENHDQRVNSYRSFKT
jgi:hypothetical protein